MFFVMLGVAGFLAGILFDVVSLGSPRFKSLAWLVMSALFGIAHVTAASWPDRLILPLAMRIVGWVLLVAGTALLSYSLFIEIPFRKTYTDASDVPGGLVTDGTYALTRHPGVLWYAVMLLGLFLGSGSRLMLVAGPIWLAMDALWVWVEDRFIFDRLFPEYSAYRRTTPMLIPNRASFLRCWNTLAFRRTAERHPDQVGAKD